MLHNYSLWVSSPAHSTNLMIQVFKMKFTKIIVKGIASAYMLEIINS
jgi:hypothetical protein